jgi:hypothetical protein
LDGDTGSFRESEVLSEGCKGYMGIPKAVKEYQDVGWGL